MIGWLGCREARAPTYRRIGAMGTEGVGQKKGRFWLNHAGLRRTGRLLWQRVCVLDDLDVDFELGRLILGLGLGRHPLAAWLPLVVGHV
jgi:hypothetical protein